MEFLQYIQIFLIFFVILLFFFVNYNIVMYDLKYKIIPNKFLGYLLLFVPLFLLYNFLHDGLRSLFFLQILVSFLVSFVLYYVGVWAAGDAKYVLVLSFFCTQVGIDLFISNIAIIVIAYLFLYYIYFYFGKCVVNLKYAKSLYTNIYVDLVDKMRIFLSHFDGKIYKKQAIRIIFNWFMTLLFFFVGMRLLRLFLVNDFFTQNENLHLFETFFKRSPVFFGITVFLAFLLGRILFSKALHRCRDYVSVKFKIKMDKTNIFFPFSLFIILLSFIVFEYVLNPYKISDYLYKIFTVYLLIYIVVKILLYSYKISFETAETYFVNINELKLGEIVDREYLVNLFGKQNCLGFLNPEGMLFPNPKKYFSGIQNPIDNDTLTKLTKIYQTVNEYHKSIKTVNFTEIDKVRIYRTFSFAPYIFLGFTLTFVFGNKILLFFLQIFVRFLKTFTS